MPDGSTPPYLAIVILLMISAFFSATEAGLMGFNKNRLEDMINEGVKGAERIKKIISAPNKLLNTIQLGSKLVNVSISVILTTYLIQKPASPGMMILVIVIIILFLLLFGDIIPKTAAAKNPERVSFIMAVPAQAAMIALSPVVLAFNGTKAFFMKTFGIDKDISMPVITESELKALVNASHEKGVIEALERTMINNVFDFGNNTAEDVMVPRPDIVSVSIKDSFEEIKSVFREEQFSRMPVYEDDIDHIIGILYFKDFIFYEGKKEDFDVQALMRPPYFSYQSKLTSELFAIMRTESIPMAVILDEYGGTLGIVTIEDLVEEIVGDISDEYDDDQSEPIVVINENEYYVDGIAKIEDFNKIANTYFESDEFDTIGGYAIELLGAIPEEGSIFENEAIRFIIEQMDKNRVEKIRIFIKDIRNKKNDKEKDKETDFQEQESD